MKIISKENLLILLQTTSKENFTVKELTKIVEYYGDDYFLVDGKLQKTGDNRHIERLKNNFKGE